MRIAILHPSLGLGGAERLVTDAACALTERGHEVSVFTTTIERATAFDELRSGAVDVRVHGRLLPSSVLGRLRAPAAIVRMSYLAMRAATEPHDLVLVDSVAHVLPVVRATSRVPVVYYCHFPDVLLTPSRQSWLYRAYRRPLDLLEQHSLGAAQLLLVNSRFTADVLRSTFPSLRVSVEVVSPGVDVEAYRPRSETTPSTDEILLLSIARYEKKKNLVLALDALAELRAQLPSELFARLKLVLVGGLSSDTPGALETYEALRSRTRQLGLSERVELKTSISDRDKRALLQRARALVFTPEGEHFGIAPIEAMASGTPVVASDSGGPRETILHGETGYLCPATPVAFAERLAQLIQDDALARRMGARAAAHAQTQLSRRRFGERLESALTRCASAVPSATRSRSRADGDGARSRA